MKTMRPRNKDNRNTVRPGETEMGTYEMYPCEPIYAVFTIPFDAESVYHGYWKQLGTTITNSAAEGRRAFDVAMPPGDDEYTYGAIALVCVNAAWVSGDGNPLVSFTVIAVDAHPIYGGTEVLSGAAPGLFELEKAVEKMVGENFLADMPRAAVRPSAPEPTAPPPADTPKADATGDRTDTDDAGDSGG